MTEVTSRLKEIIDDRGLKQGYIAERVGVRQSTISEVVRGKRLPTLPVALKIADVLGVRIEDIWSLRK
jgi:DNA-binding XRE family transcriptional regulator